MPLHDNQNADLPEDSGSEPDGIEGETGPAWRKRRRRFGARQPACRATAPTRVSAISCYASGRARQGGRDDPHGDTVRILSACAPLLPAAAMGLSATVENAEKRMEYDAGAR